MLHDAHVTALRDLIAGAISDMHKDVHGVRPRYIDFASMSVAELEVLEAETFRDVEVAIEEEASYQAHAIKVFEAKIVEIIEMGAGDRETAIRWIKDAEDDDWYDDGMFEYETGLPYGYLMKEVV